MNKDTFQIGDRVTWSMYWGNRRHPITENGLVTEVFKNDRGLVEMVKVDFYPNLLSVEWLRKMNLK